MHRPLSPTRAGWTRMPHLFRLPALRRACLLLALMVPLSAAADEVGLGRKAGVEQALVQAMSARLLERAGIAVDTREAMPTARIRAAQRRGEVDLYWEYSGTSLATFHRRRPPFPEATAEQLERVRALDEPLGLIWLEPSAVDNRYALAMRETVALTAGIDTISALVEQLEAGLALTLAVDDEFFARPDGLKPLQTIYEFTWPHDLVHRLPPEAVVPALIEGEVDVAVVGTTDGRLGPAFVLLEDDRRFFPAYRLAPVVRADALEAWPDIEPVLAPLARALDTEVMRELNRRVLVAGLRLGDVARAFLENAGLLPRTRSQDPAPAESTDEYVGPRP